MNQESNEYHKGLKMKVVVLILKKSELIFDLELQLLEIKTFSLDSRTRDVCS